MSRKFIIDSEERVLEIIAAIKEYENPFASSSAWKSKLKNIVTGSVVGSKHLNNILEVRAIGKEHLDIFTNEQFLNKDFILRLSKEAKFENVFKWGQAY